jgi:hypothetical protein
MDTTSTIIAGLDFSGQSYSEIRLALDKCETATILNLLDSESVRVGDTAAEILVFRRDFDLLCDMLMHNRIISSKGKVRATNILHSAGPLFPRAKETYLLLLKERSFPVLSNSLFGLVFLQDKSVIPKLEEALQVHKRRPKHHSRIQLAIQAIESADPFIYSPSFRDAGDTWKLDKLRFGHRIGF